jgi:DNA (cytosine-5)-methyltransferase 1
VTLTVGSLFSGIGGLDLGLERAGMEVIWQSEIDPYCNKVLKKHWPEVINHGNIKDIDWRTVQRPDIICGGYPCQPFSTAGKRKGTDDPRHLWPWVRDAISALRPKYAILENVRGHLSMGGLQVIGELAEIGYDAEWRVVSAAGMGAPHRRERIIIVAYASQLHCNGGNNNSRVSVGRETISKSGNSCGPQGVANTAQQCSNGRGLGCGEGTIRKWQRVQSEVGRGCSNVANANIKHEFQPHGAMGEWSKAGRPEGHWDDFERRCREWQVEPDVGRVADGIPSRVDRLRGLGNAVVPQVAEYIGRLVMAAELNNS